MKDYLKQNRVAILKSWLAFFIIIFLLPPFIWIAHEVMFGPLGFSPEIYNPKQANLIVIVVAVIFGLAMLSVSPHKKKAILLGVFVGAITANVLGRVLFGPVPDYILIPGVDLYANIADVLIIVTAFIISFTTQRTIRGFARG